MTTEEPSPPPVAVGAASAPRGTSPGAAAIPPARLGGAGGDGFPPSPAGPAVLFLPCDAPVPPCPFPCVVCADRGRQPAPAP